MLRTVRIETRSGSTYLVGPATDPGRIRVARVGAGPVRGTTGPLSFAWDVETVEFVATTEGLRLRIRDTDGRGFESTEIVRITEHELSDRPAWDDSEDATVVTM